jgi:hypothetical protein
MNTNLKIGLLMGFTGGLAGFALAWWLDLFDDPQQQVDAKTAEAQFAFVPYDFSQAPMDADALFPMPYELKQMQVEMPQPLQLPQMTVVRDMPNVVDADFEEIPADEPSVTGLCRENKSPQFVRYEAPVKERVPEYEYAMAA